MVRCNDQRSVAASVRWLGLSAVASKAAICASPLRASARLRARRSGVCGDSWRSNAACSAPVKYCEKVTRSAD